MSVKWYDRQGNVISMERWSELHVDESYLRVAQDTIGPYWISTVWLGLDHGFMRGGPPIIFETMVFANDEVRGDAPLLEFDMDRYATEEEAKAGHDAMCLLVRATLNETIPTEERNGAEH
jgi:hypothetical protein